VSRAALKGPAEVEVENIMSRGGGAHSTAFLVVEGDDDSRFFSSRVDAVSCEVVIGGGKPAVIGGLERLNRRNFRGALGVVDDDGDRLLGCPVAAANVVRVTGGCDLDAFLVWSDALDPVVGEYADPKKLRGAGGVDAVRLTWCRAQRESLGCRGAAGLACVRRSAAALSRPRSARSPVHGVGEREGAPIGGPERQRRAARRGAEDRTQRLLMEQLRDRGGCASVGNGLRSVSDPPRSRTDD